MLGVVDGSYELGVVTELLDQKKFRDYFKENVSIDQDRWDSLHNKMTDYFLDELLTHPEILRADMSFAMAAIDIDNEKTLNY